MASSPIIEKLLKRRFNSDIEINDFFSTDLKGSTALTALLDLEKAAQRVIDAINSGEKIGIYGDYDVDGTTSCALLHFFFKMVGVDVTIVQPSRFIEGYGIHASSLDDAKKIGTKVLITVDCGITAVEAANKARELEIDLIITDHHEEQPSLRPQAFAIINPNRVDERCPEEFKSIAGVGVAFALCMRLRELLLASGREVGTLYPLLQFVAIGTICDIAKLTPINLKLCRHGLKQLPKSEFAGLRVFLSPDERKLPFTPSEKLAFTIGPMINSKGRIDHPEIALKLLISETSEEAVAFYHELNQSNLKRKELQQEVYEKAKEQVIRELKSGHEHLISICYDQTFHEGVVGIVASKLVEEFKVPALILAPLKDDDNFIKGSGRSAGALNLFELLEHEKELFVKFGGHAKAAGFTLKKSSLQELNNRLKNELRKLPEILRTVQDSYDLEIKLSEIDGRLVRELEMFEPYGNGNSKPLFLISGATLDSFTLMKERHIRWSFSDRENSLRKINGVSFNYIGKHGHLDPKTIFEASTKKRGELKVLAYLSINRFNNTEHIQLMVEKIILD